MMRTSSSHPKSILLLIHYLSLTTLLHKSSTDGLATPSPTSNSDKTIKHLITDRGITSVLITKKKRYKNTTTPQTRTQDMAILFAGGKRGTITSFHIDTDQFTLSDELHQSKPYPIYSMETINYSDWENASSHRPTGGGIIHLVCGGGDRYATIWECRSNNDADEKSREIAEWKVRETLGPHTGWVKDVVIDTRRELMHTIGCNCIETWGRGDGTQTSWHHVTKRKIESCQNLGSTLSSDLLCLCMGEDNWCLFSGGVDGRIHLWSYDLSLPKPLQSISAHRGRVNCLLKVEKAHMLFSSGHEGTVQCRNLPGLHAFLQDDSPLATVMVGERVLTIVCTKEDKNKAEIAVGTATGLIQMILAIRNQDGSVSMLLENDLQLYGDATIHSMAVFQSDEMSKTKIAVGHSNGLSLVTM